MKYGNKSLWKSIISSSFTLIGLLILLIILTKTTWNIREKAKISDVKLSQLENELDRLEARKDNLSGQLDYLSTRQGIEAELRTKFRAIKDGESVAVILDDTKNPSNSTQPSTIIASSTVKMSWWQKILQAIGL